jgi:small-conductance mechanosensitive channel
MLWLPFGPPAAQAQPLPGIHGEGKPTGPKTRRAGAASRPRSLEEKKEALQKKIEEEKPSIWRRLYLTVLSEHSPYRSVVLAVVTLLVLLLIKKYTTRLMRSYADPRAQKKENVSRFLRTWNWAWRFIIGVFVIIALSGSLKLLGLSAAFLGMMLGWSLQAPVTGIAAWLMILLKRPFRIGDRIIIGNIIGDVTDITLTHVILNQVGGTVGGEERSGRGVLVPNAILFGQIITNYTLEEKYVLDEVPVRLTFDSDYEVAKNIMLNAAREVTADIIAETGQEPFLRCEFFDAGILVRLRYQAVPARRQELSSLITENILVGFKQHYPAIKYCLPQSVIRYRWEEE